MNSPIKQFCQSLTMPCGFTDHESKIYTNAAMMDILGMMLESSQVLDVFHAHEEVVQHKKLPLSLLSTLPGGYKESPQPWRFDFFPRFDENNVYQGAFFMHSLFCFYRCLNISKVSHLIRLCYLNPIKCLRIENGMFCSSLYSD